MSVVRGSPEYVESADLLYRTLKIDNTGISRRMFVSSDVMCLLEARAVLEDLDKMDFRCHVL